MGSVEFAKELGSELNQGALEGLHRSPDQSDPWWMGLVKFAGAAGMPWQTCEQCRLRPDYAEDTIMPPLGSPDADMLLKLAEIDSATVKPSDLRTNSLITPDPQDQIANGKTTLKIERDESASACACRARAVPTNAN